MNKQEAIKKVEQMGEYERFVNESIPKLSVLNILNQLDEPQKVVVPQFVADWYEKHKDDLEYDIWEYILRWGKQQKSEFYEWMNHANNKPLQILVNMHQFGYTVEEEKRYTIRFKNIRKETRYLKYDRVVENWYFGVEQCSKETKISHTRKELEGAGFGWVFDCEGIDIEEVE